MQSHLLPVVAPSGDTAVLESLFYAYQCEDGLRPLISSATRRNRARRSRNDKSPNLSFLDEIVSYAVQLMSFS